MQLVSLLELCGTTRVRRDSYFIRLFHLAGCLLSLRFIPGIRVPVDAPYTEHAYNAEASLPLFFLKKFFFEWAKTMRSRSICKSDAGATER